MVVTVASGATVTDVIDYELDRSGKFLQANFGSDVRLRGVRTCIHYSAKL